MKLLIASNNKGKIEEIKSILGGYFKEILSLKEAGVALEVEEDGITFEENAVKKAQTAMEALGMCALADDSGLCVDALDGAPGVYSARFGGENTNDKINNQTLLKKMEGVPDAQRGAAFVCCIALARPNMPALTAFGEVRGRILHKEAGSKGFGYDPLFYVEEYNKTFAELDGEIKNRISHRYKALMAVKEMLDQETRMK